MSDYSKPADGLTESAGVQSDGQNLTLATSKKKPALVVNDDSGMVEMPEGILTEAIRSPVISKMLEQISELGKTVESLTNVLANTEKKLASVLTKSINSTEQKFYPNIEYRFHLQSGFPWTEVKIESSTFSSLTSQNISHLRIEAFFTQPSNVYRFRINPLSFRDHKLEYNFASCLVNLYGTVEIMGGRQPDAEIMLHSKQYEFSSLAGAAYETDVISPAAKKYRIVFYIFIISLPKD